MSYLGYPRLHFSGGFLADPSTINNTPNNYAEQADRIEDLELYWNPNGTGVFDLQNCRVTKVVYGPGKETTDPMVDPIIGQSVAAVYSKAPPKLVDLDPAQQNVSEVWGMTIQVGGPGAQPGSIANYVRGNYVAGPFNAIWVQSQKGPRSSASGSGVYQSTLTGLAWDTQSAPRSSFLTALQGAAADSLSINLVVNAHNNNPPIYAFNASTFGAMAQAPYNVPAEIIAKLAPMSEYVQNVGESKGDVPTESYVNYELDRLLGQQDATTWGPTVLKATAQPYDPGNIDTKFPCGLVTGSIGPSASGDPVYYTPSRTLAPYPNSPCYFAPFSVADGGRSITLNLGNSLATNLPGYDVATDLLGPLSMVYFDQHQALEISLGNAVTVATLPSDLAAGLTQAAGIFELTIDASLLPKGVTLEQAATNVSRMPLGLVGNPSGGLRILLAEDIHGYNLRADKFVFRMNPGITDQAMGETAQVQLYVTRFGAPMPDVAIKLWKLDQACAIAYTNKTLGTGGTRGIDNLSIPQQALTLIDAADQANASASEPIQVATDSDGIARVNLMASDPGRPRANKDVDGQVYFVRYSFVDEALACGYTQDANDLLSVMVYSQLSIPAQPTWQNCIQYVLPQYQKLYPIMGRFQLGDYASVKANAEAIKNVLSLPFEDALHMPVIRDLSLQRNQAILEWIATGAPES